VSWSAAKEQRVRRGELVGKFRPTGGGPATDLLAPKDGLFVPSVESGEDALSAVVMAGILYPEAYLQTVVTGAQPRPTWACEVVDEAQHQRADCKIVTAAPRGPGFFVTATIEPRWFDAAVDPVLRLAPPE
jgi:hypothetical protein